MKKLQIKKIHIFTLAKVQALIFLVLGFLNASFYTLMLILGQRVDAGRFGGQINRLGIGVVILFILMPIFYTVIGFVSGLVLGFVYNLIARFVGGVKIEIEENKNVVARDR